MNTLLFSSRGQNIVCSVIFSVVLTTVITIILLSCLNEGNEFVTYIMLLGALLIGISPIAIWGHTIPPGHNGVVFFIGEPIKELFPEPGWWWVPFGVYRIDNIDTKEQSLKATPVMGLSKKTPTSAETPVEIKGLSIQWAPKNANCLNIEKSELEQSLDDAVGGAARAHIQDKTYQELINSKPDFEKLVKDAIESTDLENWGIEIRRINFGNILLPQAVVDAKARGAVEQAEADAEEFEIIHLERMINKLAAMYERGGMAKAKAMEAATIAYQAQVGKTTRFSIDGLSGAPTDPIAAAAAITATGAGKKS